MNETKELTQKKCRPCKGIGDVLAKTMAEDYLKDLPEWQLDAQGKSIFREYVMKDFIVSVNFIHQVAQIAEAQNHHPDIHLTNYRKLRIDLSTHAIGGLSENDFIVAAKINQLPAKLKD